MSTTVSASSASRAATSNSTTPDVLQALPPKASQEIPRFVQYTSPVSLARPGDVFSATTLPLNLIAHIISYLDDIGDVARVTRTCRLLYYMTLPQLYKHVSLRSYADIRYLNGRPEGFGSGSPFMMALNGLVTKAHASIVDDFRIWGEWKETDIKDFALGRVPDDAMMLNILLRAATDKMTRLQSFSWELDCKPLKTLYQGLGNHTTLSSLTLRFPSSRVPRPSVLVPPMVNLRVLKAIDIDPLCHPDDISLLLLQSTKLEDVRLHFSPRMRREAESTMRLDVFFGRCLRSNYKLKLKHFALQNFFGIKSLDLEQVIDLAFCKSFTSIDCFGSAGGDPRTVFVDDTWQNGMSPDSICSFRRLRTSELAMQHIEIMRRSKMRLEYMYLISQKGWGHKPVSNGDAHPGGPVDARRREIVALGSPCLDVITTMYGAALKHLLLSEHWALTTDEFANLIRCCPNLEQLGLALCFTDHNTVRLLAPFLVKLEAFRILNNNHMEEKFRLISHEERMWSMGRDLAHKQKHLAFIGVGDFIYKMGRLVDATLDDGTVVLRREIFMVGPEAVKDVAIWKMDVLDIGVDPIAPFS